jgi:hypothetical protein
MSADSERREESDEVRVKAVKESTHAGTFRIERRPKEWPFVWPTCRWQTEGWGTRVGSVYCSPVQTTRAVHRPDPTVSVSCSG